MPGVRLLLSALLSITGLYAQTARPTFRPDRVIPSFGDTPLMLAPAMLVSIYGSGLGPAEGCRGYGDQRRWETLPADNPFGVWERIVLYPTLLCDVQVTIWRHPRRLHEDPLRLACDGRQRAEERIRTALGLSALSYGIRRLGCSAVRHERQTQRPPGPGMPGPYE